MKASEGKELAMVMDPGLLLEPAPYTTLLPLRVLGAVLEDERPTRSVGSILFGLVSNLECAVGSVWHSPT